MRGAPTAGCPASSSAWRWSEPAPKPASCRLHVWLPLAHPAAPSHVSALMSGVMTKVAVYGFIRIVFDLLGPAGLVVGHRRARRSAAPRPCSACLCALLQRDLKRLLAYSTVENVGIIFIGLGLALAFKANGMAGAAALAFTAALFHVLNHSLFKSLLFFGAGAVLHRDGRARHREARRPDPPRCRRRRSCCSAAASPISALPPLNGFVSEWLIFQAVLLSPELPQWGLKLLVPAVGAMLALARRLSAACFVRAYRHRVPRPAALAGGGATRVETDAFSRAAMCGSAALCLAVGLLPGFVIDAHGAGGATPGRRHACRCRPRSPGCRSCRSRESRSSYNGLLVFVFITVSTLIAVEIIHRFASRALRRGPAWDCGFPDPSPATQYTADSFSQPLRRVFGEPCSAPASASTCRRRAMPRPARLDASSCATSSGTCSIAPIGGVRSRSPPSKLNHLQFLTIRQYLSLVFVALVVLLLVVSIWT